MRRIREHYGEHTKRLLSVQTQWCHDHQARACVAQPAQTGAMLRAPLQINLYVPEAQHNSFGVVRSLVTDSQDNNTGAPAQTFIDSDGQVGNDSARDFSAFMDGRWHMVRLQADISVATQPSTIPCGSVPRAELEYHQGLDFE